MFWTCKHPAASLVVARDATVEQVDEDFDRVTYRLSCRACGKPVEIRHAVMRGGVQAFLERGRVQMRRRVSESEAA